MPETPPEYMTEDDLTFIDGCDEVIPQADMAVWMKALGGE